MSFCCIRPTSPTNSTFSPELEPRSLSLQLFQQKSLSRGRHPVAPLCEPYRTRHCTKRMGYLLKQSREDLPAYLVLGGQHQAVARQEQFTCRNERIALDRRCRPRVTYEFVKAPT